MLKLRMFNMLNYRVNKVLPMTFLSLVFTINTFSQKHFLPGFVINSEGDTLKGYIDHRNTLQNPSTFAFRASENEPVQYFEPSNSREIKVGQYRYISAALDGSVLESGLDASKTNSGELKSVFLLPLYEGVKDLYYYKGEDKKLRLLINDSIGYQLLNYNEYVQTVTNESTGTDKQYQKKDVRYKGQLIVYFMDCPEINTHMATLNYSVGNISRLFGKYYKCIDQQPEYVMKKERIKVSYGLLAGLSSTNLHFSDLSETASMTEVVNAEYDLSYQPAFGAFVEFILARNNAKWSINTELLYNSFSTSGEYTIYVDPEYYSHFTTSVESSFLGLTLMGRYSYPIGKFRMFANLGMRYNYQVKGENTIEQVRHLYGQVVTSSPQQAFDTRNHEEAISMGLGCRLGKFALEARYSTGTGFTDYTSFNTDLRQLFLLLSYRLK